MDPASDITKYIPLSFWTCFFVNSPNGTFPTLTKNVFYSCRVKIRYALESQCTIGDNFVPCGYWICVAVTAAIIVIANFGMFANILNLMILPKSLKGSSVRRLMLMLTLFDLLATLCAIPVSLLMLLMTGRYEYSYEALEAFRIFHLLFSLGRTGSIFTTITIAIERYIAIAFPFKHWLTPKKGRCQLIALIVVVFFINLPWWLSKKTEANELYMENTTSGGGGSSMTETKYKNSSWNDLSEFPYVYKATYFSKVVYPKISVLHIFIDFAFPFPMLLVFNGLLYRSIHRANKLRQTLTISQRREMNAAKMFSIVALILLLCHTVAVAIFVCTQIRRVQFRELQFLQFLSTTLNAAINFLVYYLFGKSFRNEFWNLIHACKVYGSKVEMATANVAAAPSISSNSNATNIVELGATASIKSRTSRSTIKHLHHHQEQEQRV